MLNPKLERITLKKAQRLKSAKEISLVFTEGERIQEPSLLLIYHIEKNPVPEVFPIRAAFSIPK
ncbi:MAG: hypothetical protein RQ756_01715, partial [Flavobacteriaceae bacterium]|nr:hypothetical protein [Flavobacteriaceae bacterium]